MSLQPTSRRSILILSSHLRLGLSSGPFPSGFPTSSAPIRATWPTHPVLLDLITRMLFSEEYKSLSSSLCSFLHSPFTSIFLSQNILLNTLFWNTLSLRSSLNVSYHVSHPYKTKGKSTVFLSWSWYVWTANWKTKVSTPIDSQHSLSSVCSYFISEQNLKYLNCYAHSKELLSVFISDFLPHSDLETGPCLEIRMREEVLSAFTSSPFSLIATTKSVYVFLYSRYASTHYINIISINQKLMCTISFQAILVYLVPSNSIL